MRYHHSTYPFGHRFAQCTLLAVTFLLADNTRAATVHLLFDEHVPQASFAAKEIEKALRSRNLEVTPGNLNRSPAATTGTRIILCQQGDTELMKRADSQSLRDIGKLKAEGYALRSTNDANIANCWVIGADAAGLMYGGLELAEVIDLQGLEAVRDVEQEPYMTMRGTKFNIPLDVRTPSYTDVCDAAQQNIPEMWSLDFWREYIDTLARYRYNYVSLWSLHPFPSLIRVPEYPDVALDDVRRSTVQWKETYSLNGNGFDAPEILENVEIVRKMTIDDKIAFWREVMRYGKQRNVDFYFVTWNIFVYGTQGKYGITDSIDNPTTIDYFRQSVKQMFLTYPDLAGIGLTTGENMPKSSFEQKEQWAFQTYAQGVLDVVREQPDRRITFIHRQHQTGARDIADKFAPLIDHPNVEFIFSFKYAKAHAFSATKQPYHEGFVKDIGDLKTIWTLRNDDNYYFRWGAPDFVREFIENIPYDVSRGYYYGSDQYIWGREFLSLEPESPREIEIGKHWYHWMLWGRLGYDPTISNQRFQQMLHRRFPAVPAEKLFTAWQEASKSYPATTGFHWGSLDFQWYIEACKSQPGPAQTPSGFHDINRFITLPPHAMAGCLGVQEYLKRSKNEPVAVETSPAALSQRIHASADSALTILDQLSPAGDKELRQTLSDIRSMAYLGKYYAHKIRAAQELAQFRQDKKEAMQKKAIEELNAAALYWRYYTSTALGQYKNPLWTNRVGHVDWRKLYNFVLQDVEIAGAVPNVASMDATPGGMILQAESATIQGLREASERDGFTGSGYLETSQQASDRALEWTFEAPGTGTYLLELRYALNRAGEFPCRLFINGQRVGEIVCWTTGGPATWVWDRQPVRMNKGTNVIKMAPPDAVLVDHLNLLPAEVE